MPAYLVTIPFGNSQPRANGVDAVVVFAATTADAKALAKGASGGDPNTIWDGATVTPIVAPADLTGFVFNVKLTHPTSKAVPVNVSYTGIASDTIDLVAAALVIALNATAPIAGAAYNSATQVLKVAETTDVLGDHALTLTFRPPLAAQYVEGVHVPGFVASQVDSGLASAALSVTLAADAFVLPAVFAGLTQSK